VAAINGIIFGVEGACMKVLKDETTTNHIIAGTAIAQTHTDDCIKFL